MKDKPLVIDVPEDLLDQAQSARIDVRQTVIEALKQALMREDQPTAADSSAPNSPSRADVEAAIQASEARLASSDAPRRVFGLHTGMIWISDDFDDELPDAFWLGDEA